MKVRMGFVSNSSSSSFVIGVKEGEITKERLVEFFGLPKGCLLWEFADDLADVVVRKMRPMTIQTLLDDWSYNYDTIDELIKENEQAAAQVKYISDGWKLYEGSASDDNWDTPAETWLCYTGIDYEDNEFIFWSQGGY